MALKIWSQIRRQQGWVQGWELMVLYLSATCLYVCLCVFSGGRKILVMGSGFDQVQRATMRVLPSSDELNPNSGDMEVRLMFVLMLLHRSVVELVVSYNKQGWNLKWNEFLNEIVQMSPFTFMSFQTCWMQRCYC